MLQSIVQQQAEGDSVAVTHGRLRLFVKRVNANLDDYTIIGCKRWLRVPGASLLLSNMEFHDRRLEVGSAHIGA